MFTYTIKSDCPKWGHHEQTVTDHKEAAQRLAEMMFSGRRGSVITIEIR